MSMLVITQHGKCTQGPESWLAAICLERCGNDHHLASMRKKDVEAFCIAYTGKSKDPDVTEIRSTRWTNCYLRLPISDN